MRISRRVNEKNDKNEGKGKKRLREKGRDQIFFESVTGGLNEQGIKQKGGGEEKDEN